MEIQYELTEDDYIHFNLSHIHRSKTGQRMLLLQRFIGPFLILGGGAFLIAVLNETSWWELSGYGVIALLWFLYYPKYFNRHIRKQTKRMIQERGNEGMIGPHTMELDKDGLCDRNEFGETRVSWSGIKEVIEEDDYVYLYNASISAYILPKRGQDMEEVRQWLPVR